MVVCEKTLKITKTAALAAIVIAKSFCLLSCDSNCKSRVRMELFCQSQSQVVSIEVCVRVYYNTLSTQTAPVMKLLWKIALSLTLHFDKKK